jgi:hypothetical protein
MKRLFVLGFIMMLVGVLNAQQALVTINKLDEITIISKMNLTMDFSKAKIYNLTEEEFSRYEVDWNKDRKSIVNSCIKGLKPHVKKYFRLGNYPDAPYTMAITVTELGRKEQIKGSVEIVSANGTVLFHMDDVQTNDAITQVPALTTKLAMTKYLSLRMGRKIGKIIRDILKKESK